MGLNGGASVRNICCFIVLYGAVFVFVALRRCPEYRRDL